MNDENLREISGTLLDGFVIVTTDNDDLLIRYATEIIMDFIASGEYEGDPHDVTLLDIINWYVADTPRQSFEVLVYTGSKIKKIEFVD